MCPKCISVCLNFNVHRSVLFFFSCFDTIKNCFNLLKGIVRRANHYLSCVLDITQQLCKSLSGYKSQLHLESFTRSKQVFYESLVFHTDYNHIYLI